MQTINLEWVTPVSVLIIVIAFFASCIYVNLQKRKENLTNKHRWIEQLPSLISTLGVIGTFLGITLGLLFFDTKDLDKSIPSLLEGLKTAFYTSLAGMVGSLILSKRISSIYDKQDNGISDINIAAGEIVRVVNDIGSANNNFLQQLFQQLVLQSNKQSAFYDSIGRLLGMMNDNVSQLTNKADSILIAVGNIEQNSGNQSSFTNRIFERLSVITEINTNIGEMTDIAGGISSSQEEISNGISKVEEKLHMEVLEIEEKMNETNGLLARKFDEFTELLRKSNTEALVEVMKNVTREFQQQMNVLISKLVQENFEQLNQSVERLNKWQQENKEMISSLTKQYKDMVDDFEKTSEILSSVGNDTKMLVSDGGKLKQLIDSLNEVLIEDTKFVEITTKLDDTVSITKDNMKQFDESTKALNNWVRKQRNFVDSVQLLIEKLDELNNLRNYNEQFWQSTKRSMEEGVGIIQNGSRSLNEQLVNLDRQFYARLSTTLAELDSCIQAMVNGNTRV